MSAVSRKSDAEIVARLREWIRQGKSDQWIGMQARLLLEPWTDTGSGPGWESGAVIELPNEQTGGK